MAISALSTYNVADTFALQSAIGAYSDEAYTTARKLSGTGIVGSDSMNIDTSTETYIGQSRWLKPLNPVINVMSLSTSTAGTITQFESQMSTYIKTARSHGVRNINMTQLVTQIDGLAKVGRDFANTRAQDEHNAILALLKGVGISEALRGAGGGGASNVGLGGQTFTNDDTSGLYGFYVDLGSAAPVKAYDNTKASMEQGAQRAEGFIQAFGKAWKDYEPDYAYLITSPEVMASLRSANLVDQVRVTDGSIDFETIFNGKLRLIQTRATQSISTAELTMINTGPGVDIVGTKTSFIVLPGAIAMKPLVVPTPVEFDREAKAYLGGGTTELWYRWGYVAHPTGYDWAGLTTAFPSDAGYQAVSSIAGNAGGVYTALASVTNTNSNLTNNATASSATAWVQGAWQRKATSALSLGILPIFHA